MPSGWSGQQMNAVKPPVRACTARCSMFQKARSSKASRFHTEAQVSRITREAARSPEVADALRKTHPPRHQPPTSGPEFATVALVPATLCQPPS